MAQPDIAVVQGLDVARLQRLFQRGDVVVARAFEVERRVDKVIPKARKELGTVDPRERLLEALILALETCPRAPEHILMAVGGVVVVAKDRIGPQARARQTVEQSQHIGQPAVVVQKVAGMDQQIVVQTGAGAADTDDLGLFAPVFPAEVRVGEM